MKDQTGHTDTKYDQIRLLTQIQPLILTITLTLTFRIWSDHIILVLVFDAILHDSSAVMQSCMAAVLLDTNNNVLTCVSLK